MMPVAALSSDQSPDVRYDNFLEASEKIIESGEYDRRQSLISIAYQNAVAGFDHPDVLSARPDRDLHFLQLTAEAALYYGASAEIADDAELFFNEAARRPNEAGAALIYNRSMLLAGRWDAASTVEPLLPVAATRIRVDSASTLGEGRAVLTARGTNYFEQTQRTPLTEGVYIIGHESCAWTRRALADLGNDAAANDFVSHRAMLLSPSNTVLQGVRSEDSPFAVVVRASDWPEVREWSLPSFVFVQGGEVVDHFSGWPGPESIERFRAAMTKIHSSSPNSSRDGLTPK